MTAKNYRVQHYFPFSVGCDKQKRTKYTMGWNCYFSWWQGCCTGWQRRIFVGWNIRFQGKLDSFNKVYVHRVTTKFGAQVYYIYHPLFDKTTNDHKQPQKLSGLCRGPIPTLSLYPFMALLSLFLTLSAHVQRGWQDLVCECVCPSVCLSVCLSVCYHNFATPGYKAAKERYRQPQCNVVMDTKNANFLKVLCSKVVAWNTSEEANMLMNEFELTVDGFRAFPRTTKRGNYLIDNWWTERCLRGWLQRQTAGKRRENR